MAAPLFRNRAEAGRELGRLLKAVMADSDSLVLALPRGGVPVAFEVAQALHAELDIFIVRKLGVPGREELAMGAIASGGIRVVNRALIEELGLSAAIIDRITARERKEVERREVLYREGRPAAAIAGRPVILVDDGLATGASMFAVARAVRIQNPKRIVVGVPVSPRAACSEFRHVVDNVVCVQTPEPFYAIGVWYEDFSQTSDAEVQELLRRAATTRVT
jgi:putative phosphoribosyl transferase